MPSLRKALAGHEENPVPPIPPGATMLEYAEILGFKVIGDESIHDGKRFIEGPDLCRMMNSAQREADDFEKAKKPRKK